MFFVWLCQIFCNNCIFCVLQLCSTSNQATFQPKRKLKLSWIAWLLNVYKIIRTDTIYLLSLQLLKFIGNLCYFLQHFNNILEQCRCLFEILFWSFLSLKKTPNLIYFYETRNMKSAIIDVLNIDTKYCFFKVAWTCFCSKCVEHGMHYS